MSKAQNVVEFFVICNKLQSVIRKGYLDWNVKAERIESVAEHVYSTQMLAIAMYSEYDYNIDLSKVLLMIAIHELEETVIGDLTPFEISKEEKLAKGHRAVIRILSGLNLGKFLKEIIFEFDERKTPEAIFAFHCDKLQCDLEVKLYDEKGYVDINDQDNNKITKDEKVKKLLSSKMSWSEMWLNYDKDLYLDDENFLKVLNYAMNNNISF